MKIRTITTGTNFSYPIEKSKIVKIGQFSLRAKEIFEDKGIKVQTLRIVTQPWEEYLGRFNHKTIVDEVKNVEQESLKEKIDFLNIGTVKNLQFIDLIPEIISATSIISTSVTIGDFRNKIDFEAAKRAAKVILRISQETERGYGNFRFAAISNCPPDIPFFPASYHKGKLCFSIGMECSDLVSMALGKAENLASAEKNLRSTLEYEFGRIEKIAKDIEKKEKIRFKGIDASPAPSLEKEESLAFAFEKLNLGKFGSPGTLAVAGMLTNVLKSLRVEKCGYCGLMLPILEDYGLAQRYGEGIIDIDTLLAYSSICGTGLDCIPLPGNISEEKIYAILLDIATLSIKLNKPLSARLFPVPNKTSGEMTDFKSPYLIDCKIPEVK